MIRFVLPLVLIFSIFSSSAQSFTSPHKNAVSISTLSVLPLIDQDLFFPDWYLADKKVSYFKVNYYRELDSRFDLRLSYSYWNKEYTDVGKDLTAYNQTARTDHMVQANLVYEFLPNAKYIAPFVDAGFQSGYVEELQDYWIVTPGYPYWEAEYIVNNYTYLAIGANIQAGFRANIGDRFFFSSSVGLWLNTNIGLNDAEKMETPTIVEFLNNGLHFGVKF